MPELYSEELDGLDQAVSKFIEVIGDNELDKIYKYGLLITTFNNKLNLTKKLTNLGFNLDYERKDKLIPLEFRSLNITDLITMEKYFNKNSSGKKIKIRKRLKRVSIQKIKDVHRIICEYIFSIVADALTSDENINKTNDVVIGNKVIS